VTSHHEPLCAEFLSEWRVRTRGERDSSSRSLFRSASHSALTAFSPPSSSGIALKGFIGKSRFPYIFCAKSTRPCLPPTVLLMIRLSPPYALQRIPSPESPRNLGLLKLLCLFKTEKRTGTSRKGLPDLLGFSLDRSIPLPP